MSATRAFFSGYGRLVLHNGARLYDIQIASGRVTDLGSMVLPPHNTCSDRGAWGLAESFGGALYLDYASGNEIERTRVGGGTTTLKAFSDLGQVCAIGFSPSARRWYFEASGASQFAPNGTATLGACGATYRRPNATPVCNDGVLEAGETCDGDCPASCDDGVACTADHQTGSAATCDIACTHTTITSCAHGDGCCPEGCDHGSDHDCASSCGDGLVEAGETCDGDCPSSCDDGNTCSTDGHTGSAATCDLTCTHQPIVTCLSGDGCCAPGCTSLTDTDCSRSCGNGVIEAGETCDGDCPTSCDDHIACTSDVLTGSAAGCSAACTHATITACFGGDGCCPAGCNANDDHDCSPSCGNGVVESGEVCDGSCPASCNDNIACTIDSLTGSADTCSAVCAHQTITACTNGDGCCPAGCNANTDNDCQPVCGNGVVEGGEACDGSCPSTCNDNVACTADTLTGSAAACTATCGHTTITACTNGDGCCPSGCSANTDSDCAPICGNGVVESGEACDGNCPTTCTDANACTNDVLTGSAGSCSAVCTHPAITACANGDGCCPSGCNSVNDGDCPVYALDGVSASGAWALRRLRGAYTGYAVQLRRGSDSATMDFGFSGESLDASAITAWLGGSTGYVTRLYDQSGGGNDLVQASASNQPPLVLDSQAGRPGISLSPNLRLATTAGGPVGAVDHSLVGVCRAGASGSNWTWCLSLGDAVAGANSVVGFDTSQRGWYGGWGFTSAVGTTSFTGTTHVLSKVYAASTHTTNGWLDAGGNVSSTAATYNLSSGVVTVGYYGSAVYYEGYVFATALSSTSRFQLESSAAIYWGTAALGTQLNPGSSCAAILAAGASQGDGLYWIDPNGGSKSDGVQTFCDMTTDGGGFTALAMNGDLTADTCSPGIGPTVSGCGSLTTTLGTDWAMAGSQQAGLSWSRLLFVAYGSSGYSNKLAYFGTNFGTAQTTASSRSGGTNYTPPAAFSTNFGAIVCSSSLGYVGSYALTTGTSDPYPSMTKFCMSATPGNYCISFHDYAAAAGSITGFDDFQNGTGCSDLWAPAPIRGARAIVLVR